MDVHKDNYKNLQKQTTNLAFEKKRIYYSERLENSSQSLYSVTNKLVDKKEEYILPDTKSDLEPSDATSIAVLSNQLSSFQRFTDDDIHQIVLSYDIKCSPEESLPPDFLKNNIDLFLPLRTEPVNLSLSKGSMGMPKKCCVSTADQISR